MRFILSSPHVVADEIIDRFIRTRDFHDNTPDFPVALFSDAKPTLVIIAAIV